MTVVIGLHPAEVEIGLAAPEHGSRTPAPFGRRACEIVANDQLGAYRLLSIDDPEGPTPSAGQFYMLAASEGWGSGDSQRPYLPRAFSVCRVRARRLQFLVESIGPGTRKLASLARGETLWIAGPLGVGFSLPAELAPAGTGSAGAESRAVLVGGGAGVAPLAIWSERLVADGVAVRSLLGFRGAAHCEAAGLVAGERSLATDDGSRGRRGLVTELLADELERSPLPAIYACGPPAMLEEVRRLSAERRAPAELALEEAMACGYGACFGCVVETSSGFRRICVDGPVVRASDLCERWVSD